MKKIKLIKFLSLTPVAVAPIMFTACSNFDKNNMDTWGDAQRKIMQEAYNPSVYPDIWIQKGINEIRGGFDPDFQYMVESIVVGKLWKLTLVAAQQTFVPTIARGTFKFTIYKS